MTYEYMIVLQNAVSLRWTTNQPLGNLLRNLNDNRALAFNEGIVNSEHVVYIVITG